MIKKGIRRAGGAVLCSLLLQGCLTTALWDCRVGDSPWVDLRARLILTPLTLLLDVLTAPIQCWALGHDPDESPPCR